MIDSLRITPATPPIYPEIKSVLFDDSDIMLLICLNFSDPNRSGSATK